MVNIGTDLQDHNYKGVYQGRTSVNPKSHSYSQHETTKFGDKKGYCCMAHNHSDMITHRTIIAVIILTQLRMQHQHLTNNIRRIP